jgi:hypothetical protein
MGIPAWAASQITFANEQPSLVEGFASYWCFKIEQKCRSAVSSKVDKD